MEEEETLWANALRGGSTLHQSADRARMNVPEARQPRVRYGKARVQKLEQEVADLRNALERMLHLAKTGEWEGEDPLVESEALLRRS